MRTLAFICNMAMACLSLTCLGVFFKTGRGAMLVLAGITCFMAWAGQLILEVTNDDSTDGR